MERVKSGSRKMYERMRAAENCGRLGAIVSFCIALLDFMGANREVWYWYLICRFQIANGSLASMLLRRFL